MPIYRSFYIQKTNIAEWFFYVMHILSILKSDTAFAVLGTPIITGETFCLPENLDCLNDYLFLTLDSKQLHTSPAMRDAISQDGSAHQGDFL